MLRESVYGRYTYKKSRACYFYHLVNVLKWKEYNVNFDTFDRIVNGDKSSVITLERSELRNSNGTLTLIKSTETSGLINWIPWLLGTKDTVSRILD